MRLTRIQPPTEGLGSIVGSRRAVAGEDAGALDLRVSGFCVSCPCERGTLLHSTLTGEMLLLEGATLDEATADPELRRELLAARVLVPRDTDEVQMADEARFAWALLAPKREAITSFTIFTTMDCNARCFYCYELGRPRPHMSEQTAHDVAAFIAEVSRGEEVSLHWFGGEPLYNARAIDVITDDLAERGVPMRATIISNSYLFDAAIAHRAVERWHIRRAQVTIDGTEDVYNRAKAYVDAEGSPFERVLDNMGHMLDEGIRISVRLNVHGGNVDDLCELAAQLAERFAGRAGLHAYAAPLTAGDGGLMGFATPGEALEAMVRLRTTLEELGLAGPRRLRRDQQNHCMADSDQSVTILPTGRLGKCEHYSESEFVGSIYEGVTDLATLAAWKKPRKSADACATCALYPSCVDIAKCPYKEKPCDEFERGLRIDDLRRRMLGSYRHRQEGAT